MNCGGFVMCLVHVLLLHFSVVVRQKLIYCRHILLGFVTVDFEEG